MLLRVKLLKGNFTSLVLIILSLSLVIATVVSNGIILDSNNESMFELTQKNLAEEYIYHINLDIIFQRNRINFSVEQIDQIVMTLNDKLASVRLDTFIQSSWIQMENIFLSWNGSETNNELIGYAYYYEPNKAQELETLLLPGGRLPLNSNETILALPNRQKTAYLTNTSLYISTINVNVTTAFPITVVGVLPFYEEEDFSSERDYFRYCAELDSKTGLNLALGQRSHIKSFLITQKQDYNALTNRLELSYGDQSSEPLIYQHFILYYRFNTIALQAHDSLSYLERLKEFQDFVSKTYETNVHYSDFEEEIEIFQVKWIQRFLENEIIAIPLILISLSLINAIINQVRVIQKNKTEALKIRGISFQQIFPLALLEGILSFGLINGLGIILGVGITLPLVFFMNAAPKLVLAPSNWISYVLMISGLLTCIVFSKIIYQRYKLHSKSETLSLRQPEIVPIRSNPLKILLIGFLAYCFSFLLTDLIKVQYLPITVYTFEALISIVVTISTFFIFFGTIYSLRTLFLRFFHFLGALIWKTHPNMAGLALKNITRYAKSNSDLWLILTLLIAYTFVIQTYSSSIDHNFHQQAQFFTGADYRLTFQKSDEASIIDFLQHNMTELIAFTPVTHAHLEHNLRYDEYGEVARSSNMDLLGIESDTFFDVAYNHPQTNFYTSLTNFQTRIQNDPHSVSVSEGFLAQEGLTYEDSYSLQVMAYNYTPSSSRSEYYYLPVDDITISASFHIYPLIATISDSRAMILSRNILTQIETNTTYENSTFHFTHYFLLKSSSSLSTDDLHYLEEEFQVEITSSSEEYLEFKQRASWDQMLALQQGNVLVSLILAGSSLLIFRFFQLTTRTREHAIEYALGMKHNSVIQMILLEDGFIIIAAICGGVIAGLLFSIAIISGFSLAGSTRGIHPYLILPITTFPWYLLWFILFLLLSIIPPIVVARKYDTGVLLKRYV